jgi:excinuclease ABC subunit A
MHSEARECCNNGDEYIRVRGARMHNLQNLDLDLPRDRLLVVTGPSGSGKSSLAFDTLYAEGQRQYIESLSVYARQFLHQLERPDVDLIEGLQPTISIDQRAGTHNPRSTVATVTEIYDYLRLFYARLGEPSCHQCGTPIRQQSPEQILERLLARPEGTRMMILAPMVRGRKGQHREVLERIRKAGFLRARIDGAVVDLAEAPPLVPQKAHNIEAVIDRIVIRPTAGPRLAEAIQLAVRHGDGLVLATAEQRGAGRWQDELFSTQYACPSCGLSYEELEPRTFSFNSPYGACPACEGLGARVGFDPDLVLPDRRLSLAEGAVAPWKGATTASARRYRGQFDEWCEAAGVKQTVPLDELKPKVFEQLLHGDGAKFPGLLLLLEKECATTTNEKKRERLEGFRGEVVCADCHGARLRPEARAVRVSGRAIHEVTALSVAAAAGFFQGLTLGDGPDFRGHHAEHGRENGTVPFDALEDQREIAKPLLHEIAARLTFLNKVGLDYLTLDRSAETLSGGELQRVRLASGLGSGLVGVCYVLDEPSIGLHPRDNQRLIEALRQLQSRGNTVLVVEHDEAIMRSADWLLDLGPGAGRHGGRIVARGTPEEIIAAPNSLTGRYLSGRERIGVPPRRRVAVSRSITIEGVTTNNLKQVTARCPLSALVCVTGVSGSGKSSLLSETLGRALRRRLTGEGPKPGPHASLRGASQIDKLVEIDQTPIGRTPRSNPATYTGVFDEVRKVFANTRDARSRGYKAGRFSFNIKGGRCEHCQGQGQQRIEMNFLPDLYITCPVCAGKRFNRQTLEIRYRSLSIADVLDLRVDEAVEFFENFPAIARLLGSLQQVGLGYVTLGQSSTTLSGGEAQRIKLANELGRVDTGKTFYILDEPTTGLHFDDIKKLMVVLERLVELGNTVAVIEHHLDVIKSADWIIDLGPEGGEQGGQIVATGTPEQIAALEDNYTGQFLRACFNGDGAVANP